MTPEAQRIAIAGACGWKRVILSRGDDGIANSWYWSNAEGEDMGTGDWSLPDYLTDLNAMHEAEKTLKDSHANDQWSPYCVELNRIACGCGNLRTCGFTIAADAAQRAEAFLRTLNLWTP